MSNVIFTNLISHIERIIFTSLNEYLLDRGFGLVDKGTNWCCINHILSNYCFYLSLLFLYQPPCNHTYNIELSNFVMLFFLLYFFTQSYLLPLDLTGYKYHTYILKQYIFL